MNNIDKNIQINIQHVLLLATETRPTKLMGATDGQMTRLLGSYIGLRKD
jgi:hypothetical protein